jgi:putative membrane protein
MNQLHKQVFLVAVAAAAVVALATAPLAQEAKKDASDKQQQAKKEMKKDQAAKGGPDAKHAHQIAQSDLAEVQAGKLGVSKASSPEVKKFAQSMVDDHGKHLGELRSMAKTKGMQLPSAPAKKHQAAMKKLQSASGAEFDKLYMTQMVKDHEEALKLVQDTAKNAKDAELKADAQKTAPVIQKHLDEAKRIAASLK